MKIRFEVSPDCLDRIRVHVEGQLNRRRFQWTTDFDPNLALGGLIFHVKDRLRTQMPELVKAHPDDYILKLCSKLAHGIVDFGALPETQARMKKDWEAAVAGSSKAVAWVRKQLEHDVKNIVKAGIRRQDALLAFEQTLDEQLVKAVHES